MLPCLLNKDAKLTLPFQIRLLTNPFMYDFYAEHRGNFIDLHKFEEAIKRNIVVYDSDAPIGLLTYRLLVLMKTAFKGSFKHSFDYFLIDKNEMSSLNETAMIKLEDGKIDIREVDTFNILEEYNKRGCYLGALKRNVIIAVDKEGYYLGIY